MPDIVNSRYNVIESLGLGGMGEVFKVLDGTDGQEKALKILKPGLISRIDSFKDEFKILTQLHYPYLVRVYDFGLDQNKIPFYTMDYLTGGDIKARAFKISLKEFYRLALTALAALDYIHSRNIIHGDLKPSNIMFDELDNLRLVDFGLAVHLHSDKAPRSSGTLEFAPPEMIKSQGYSSKSDLYSLGLVLYEVLFDRPFFEGTTSDILAFKLEKKIELPPFPGNKGGPALQSIMSRMIENNPGDRFGSAGEAFRAFEKLYYESELDGAGYRYGTFDTSRDYFERAAFSGREEEYEILKRSYESLADGRNKLIYISGESGVGKSRLTEQFKYDIQMEGGHFIGTICDQHDNRPLAPLIKILEQLFLNFDADLEHFTELGDEIKRLFPRLFPDLPGEPDINRGRQRLFDNLFKYIQDISSGRPLVLLIEDLQWADSQTIDFLDYLARLGMTREITGGNGFLLIVSSRIIPEALDWEFKDFAERMELKPADQLLWQEYINNLFGDFEPPQEFSEKLFHETGGNFFFVEELLKSFADGKALVRSGGFWKLRPEMLVDFATPRTVQESIERRLSGLSLQHQVIVDQAAAIGSVFNPEDVLILAGYSQEARELLNELVTLRVFHRQNGDFAFLNNQIKNVAYAAIDEAKKPLFHRRIAQYFEARGAEPDFLASHFAAADDKSRALKYLFHAADNANAVFGWQQASDFYGQALDLIKSWDDPPESARFKALLGRGAALVNIDPRRAETIFDDALYETQNTADHDRNEVSVLIRQAENSQHLGDNEKSLRLYDRALGVGGSDDRESRWPDLTGEAYMGKGWTLSKLGNLDDAGKQYFKALDYFIDNPERMCRVLSYLGIVSIRQGDFAGGLDFYNRSLKVCQDNDYKWPAMQLYGNIGNVYNARNEYNKALEYYTKSMDIALDISDRRIEAINLLNIGNAYNNLGKPNNALVNFEQALKIQKAIGDRGSEGICYNNLAETFLILGSLKKAYDYALKGLEVAREIKEPRIELANRRSAADALLAVNDIAEADRFIGAALRQADEIKDDFQKSWALAIKAEIACNRENYGEAETIIERVLESDIEDVGLRVRLLVCQAEICFKHKNLTDAGSTIKKMGKLDLPISLKSSYHYLRGKIFYYQADDVQSLSAAEKELELAIGLADKYNTLNEKPKYLFHLAMVRKERGINYKSVFERAKNLASGLCVGWPAIVQQRYIKQYELDLQDAVEEQIMEKSSKEKGFEILFEVAKSINSILELDPLLNRVMDLMLENMNAERGFIMLKDNDGKLEPVVARNIDKETIIDEDSISHSTTNDVFKTGKPLLMNRTPGENLERESVVDFHITSIICAPLILNEQISGIVYIDSRATTHVFNNDDLEFLQSFCNLAAIAIENARLADHLSDQNVYLQKQVERSSSFKNIIGRSSPMQKVFRMAESVAGTDATVVITGESGTGKELLARAIHFASQRKSAKFIPVDCGALPESLLESELFGHKKGSFTGAISDRVGLFDEANGGTIFLDEVTNTSMNFQVKLLRVIQEGEFRRVGDVKSRRVDIRIIAATNKNLESEVKAGKFREDLYYRLNVVNIPLPALRERKEDIPILANYFLESVCQKMKISSKSITSKAIDYLVNYKWPGNVRQLENVIERIVIFSKDQSVDVSDLPQEIKSMFDNMPADSKTQLSVPKTKVELKAAKAQLDRLFLVGVMEQADGNVMQAARLSGMDRTQLHHMFNKYSIDAGTFRKK